MAGRLEFEESENGTEGDLKVIFYLLFLGEKRKNGLFFSLGGFFKETIKAVC